MPRCWRRGWGEAVIVCMKNNPWFETLCPFKIEVINMAKAPTNDLVEDLAAILTSFAARLYGQRRGRQKTAAAIKALQETGA